MTRPRATSVDKIVGAMIKEKRKARGMSQQKLGDKAGKITFQQVQKYENGTNRVSIGRLLLICGALKVTAVSFVREIEQHQEKRRSRHAV